MITLSLDLTDASLSELTTLIDAAIVAGADSESKLTVEDGKITITVDASQSAAKAEAAAEKEKNTQSDEVETPEVQSPSIVNTFENSPIGEAVRQVVSEEAVRSLVDNLLYNRSNRRF